MRYRIKFIFSLAFFVFLQVTDLIAVEPMGVKAVNQFTKGMDELANKHLPPIVKLAENFNETAKVALPMLAKTSPEFGKQLGEKFGYKTVKLIFKKLETYAGYGVACGNKVIVFASDGLTYCAAGATKAAATIKSGATVVISAPATPYIVVGVVCVAGGGYVCYKVYCYYNPSTGEKIIATEEEIKLYKAKTEANKAKAEANRSKINLYKSKVDHTEAKKEMMVKMTAQIAASTAVA